MSAFDSNVFALLGDDENEDPQVLAAKAPKPVKKEAPKEEAKPGEESPQLGSAPSTPSDNLFA